MKNVLPVALQCGSPEKDEEQLQAEAFSSEEEEPGWGLRGWEIFHDIDY